MYICSVCEYGSPIKLGKCPSCGSFGSFVQDLSKTREKGSKHTLKTWHDLGQSSISSWIIQKSQLAYWDLTDRELKRVFQQGIKPGGMYLLGGEPGIGKSTIILQIIQNLIVSQPELAVMYLSGEEWVQQVAERYQRISQLEHQSEKKSELANELTVYHTTHLEDIVTTIQASRPDIVIVDSIQTIYSTGIEASAWSPQQVRTCAEKLSELCKQLGVTCFVIGHVTKGGEIAGPKYLEHIVDVVLSIEGDRYGQLRFLKSFKNRFGHTEDTAIFEMTLFWLKPVTDLKERILNAAHLSVPGSVLTIGLDNGRPVIVSVEVLLNKTHGKYPERSVVGCDPKRVWLIVAILEKYLKLTLSVFDLYVNIPGEFKLYDSGLDLAIATAIWSQAKWQVIDKTLVFVWELGLAGQVSPSKLHPKRVRELPEGYTIVDHQMIKHLVELPGRL